DDGSGPKPDRPRGDGGPAERTSITGWGKRSAPRHPRRSGVPIPAGRYAAQSDGVDAGARGGLSVGVRKPTPTYGGRAAADRAQGDAGPAGSRSARRSIATSASRWRASPRGQPVSVSTMRPSRSTWNSGIGQSSGIGQPSRSWTDRKS